MIAFQEVHNRILSRCDAENSDRYTFEQDTKYAGNSAMEILVTWFNQAFADKKLSPESLRELTNVKVWQANSYSRVAFNSQDVGHFLWTLLAIYPKPVITKKSAPVGFETTNSVSKFRPDITFIDSVQSAKRLNFEEWNENRDNAFMPGNDILKGKIAEYAYLDAADYSSSTYTSSVDKIEWTIRPAIPNEFVALAYLKYPRPVAAITDYIEFPLSLTELIVEIASSIVALKQPTQSLYAASEQNVNRLVSLIKNS